MKAEEGEILRPDYYWLKATITPRPVLYFPAATEDYTDFRSMNAGEKRLKFCKELSYQATYHDTTSTFCANSVEFTRFLGHHRVIYSSAKWI